MDRVYQGVRDRRGIPEIYVLESTRRLTLHEQLVLTRPIEFDWGYCGKEPRNLALSLLADALEGGDHPLVDELYERLHDELVGELPAEGWQIRQVRILDWAFGKIPRIPVEPLPLELLGGGVTPELN
ncbi:MAG: DUF6166 domain-containing protein [Actinomycetota bacterium]